MPHCIKHEYRPVNNRYYNSEGELSIEQSEGSPDGRGRLKWDRQVVILGEKEIKKLVDLLKVSERRTLVQEIQKLADTTPPNLLLNAIVSKFY
jgi:hypothetical protein